MLAYPTLSLERAEREPDAAKLQLGIREPELLVDLLGGQGRSRLLEHVEDLFVLQRVGLKHAALLERCTGAAARLAA